MTAFECDEPADFMHLMLTLRESEASRYTERDTPIFVGQHVADPRRARRARRRAVRVGRSPSRTCADRARCATWRSRDAETSTNASAGRPAGRAEDERADRDDDQQRSAVEDDLRPRRPRLDLLAPLAPEQIDEERDREEERDPRDHVQRRRAST